MDHQTFAQLLGNYGEFVGAIAVVATLVYLARQVRDSCGLGHLEADPARRDYPVLELAGHEAEKTVVAQGLPRQVDGAQAQLTKAFGPLPQPLHGSAHHPAVQGGREVVFLRGR